MNTGWRLAAGLAAWPLGAAWQLQESVLQPLTVYAAWMASGALLIGLMAVAWWLASRRHAPSTWAGPVAAGGVALGLALLAYGATGYRASVRLAEVLPPALEARDLQVTGVVASLPQRSANGLRFRFEVEQATLHGQPVAVPALLALGWYRGFEGEATLSAAQRELRAGQRWQFTVRLRRPHGLANPHGFDQELRWFEDGVRATGSVRERPPPRWLAHAAGYPVERLRQRVRDAIDAAVPDARVAGVLAALAVGDQSAIERDDWELFRRSGVAHLMSVSGVHVTMFAALAGMALGSAWRRSARAMAWLPAPSAARWGGCGVALAYAVFSGWGVPAQRTVWMLAAVTLLRGAGLRWPWPLVLLSAAAVVAVADPWALLQPGFWLSFTAVGLLLVSGDGLLGTRAHPPGAARHPEAEPVAEWETAQASTPDADAGPRPAAPPTAVPRIAGWLRGELAAGLRSQLIATVGLAPLTLVFFQQLSLVGLVANGLAIPLVTLLITPLALLGCVVPLLWGAAAVVTGALLAGLQWLTQAPEVLWSVGVAPWWAQAAGLLAGALLVMPLPWRLRLLAVPLAWPLLLPPRALPPVGAFELVAADVGQGTAVLVRTRQHLLLYDTGPQYGPDNDAGQRVLLPLLRARGEARIDALVLSHRDTDHVGGAATLLRSVPVALLSSSVEDAHPLWAQARQQGSAVRRCAAGQRWEWDGVRFEMLHPGASDDPLTQRSNAMSCVLRIEGKGEGAQPGHSALLTGDIEREQELELVRAHGEALRSTVLVVPHHGSKTSSTSAFLEAVAPQAAVFQAGHLNRYGHPAAEVLARYLERGIVRLDTPSCGAWSWRSDDPAGPQPASCERTRSRRYWHWSGHFPSAQAGP